MTGTRIPRTARCSTPAWALGSPGSSVAPNLRSSFCSFLSRLFPWLFLSQSILFLCLSGSFIPPCSTSVLEREAHVSLVLNVSRFRSGELLNWVSFGLEKTSHLLFNSWIWPDMTKLSVTLIHWSDLVRIRNEKKIRLTKRLFFKFKILVTRFIPYFTFYRCSMKSPVSASRRSWWPAARRPTLQRKLTRTFRYAW